jgi:hypothetical protein
MNVGELTIHPLWVGLPAADEMVSSRIDHSSLRTGKPSTWRRVIVIKLKLNRERSPEYVWTTSN